MRRGRFQRAGMFRWREPPRARRKAGHSFENTFRYPKKPDTHCCEECRRSAPKLSHPSATADSRRCSDDGSHPRECKRDSNFEGTFLYPKTPGTHGCGELRIRRRARMKMYARRRRRCTTHVTTRNKTVAPQSMCSQVLVFGIPSGYISAPRACLKQLQ